MSYPPTSGASSAAPVAAIGPICDVEAGRQLFGRIIVPFEFIRLPDGPVRNEITCRALPGLGLAHISSGTSLARRTARHLINDDVFFVMNLSGTRTVSQHGREGTIEAGEALLSNGGEVGTTAIKASRFIVLGLPRKAIAAAVPQLDDKVARPIRRDRESLHLLAGYAATLRDARTLASPQAQRLAVTHVYDLIALALGAAPDAADEATARGLRAARREAVLCEIKACFARRDFSAQQVALKLGLSPRYIQELLQESGTSFTERVLELRLQKARAALADANHAARDVVDIAVDCGFSDISYFNRCFRRRFGDTPSGVRGMARRRH
jgi:AraC-like DNA-binding protein